METIWKHSVYVICTSASMPGAIAALDVAFPCDDENPRDPTKPDQVGCRLSATGQAPATHYGAAFSVTEEIRENLESMGLANTPGIIYWRCSNPEMILATTNNQPDHGSIDHIWDWSKCLQSCGLQPVIQEIGND